MEIGKKLLLVLIVIVNLTDGFTYKRVYRESEICGYHNGHRKYLDEGETGKLSATNISVPSEVTKRFNQTLTMQCTLELVTCPSCIIRLKFNHVNFPSNCDFPKNGAGVCRCDYIALSEPPYDTQQNIIYNCGKMQEYRTQTRSIQIRFVYWNNYTDAFQLEYTAERNREVITLSDSTELNNQDVEISSPFFPAAYPRDHSNEYVVTCNTEGCRIHLIFSDFQLARASSMEFYDTNGERLFITGTMFRPPVLITSGSSLMMRFYANGASDVGFKGKLSYLSEEGAKDPDLKVRTGCGGLVESVGGAITMMDMVDSAINETSPELFYDCIWIVRPPLGYRHMKTHLSLKVETFDKMASQSYITVIQGMTSDQPILEMLESSEMQSVSSRNLVVPVTSGFYVRLRGKFNADSRLAIVYTAFSYSKCYVGGEFLCQNQRCIPLILQCDGFNQCGDDSDEPESCPAEWANSVVDRRWYSHTPNYYFPKTDRFPDLQTTTMAFIITSISLMIVISCLIISLYKNGNRSREQEELQNQLNTISQLLDGSNSNLRPEEITEPPPIYEAPPTYDEIIKVGMDDQITKVRRERRSGRKSRLNRPRRSDPAVSYQSNLLETSGLDDSDIPSTSSIGSGSPYFTGRNASQESFMPSIHMLEIAEAPEAAAPHKVKSGPVLSSTTTSFNAVRGSFEDSSLEPIHSSSQTNSRSYQEVPTPNHLWSNDSKFKRSWIRFNSDDKTINAGEFQIARSIDPTAHGADDYFQAYGIQGSTQNDDSAFPSMSSCCCDSSQSIFSEKFKTSLMINQMECERCKNLIRSQANRRCSMCCDCVEKLYSPKVCTACKGRISFEDLKELNSQQQINKKCFNESNDPSGLKLCNCFPKYPSQHFSSIQPNEPNEIQILPQIVGKSCSYNELVVQQKKKSTPHFYSHNCLQGQPSSDSDRSPSDEE